jgi:hypothetical protein
MGEYQRSIAGAMIPLAIAIFATPSGLARVLGHRALPSQRFGAEPVRAAHSANKRKGTFMVGSRKFGPQKVGYDPDHSPFKNGMFVTDPLNANGMAMAATNTAPTSRTLIAGPSSNI